MGKDTFETIIDDMVFFPEDTGGPAHLVHFWAEFMVDSVQFGGGWEDIPAWKDLEKAPTEKEVREYVNHYQTSLYGDLRRFQEYHRAIKEEDIEPRKAVKVLIGATGYRRG